MEDNNLKIKIREEVSSQKKHWVRLTKTCNNNCIFCLDKDTENGSYLPFAEIIVDLKKGKALNCSRVILSGGEATLHPDFLRIVKEAKNLNYERIQVVTNGRMFAYKKFLQEAVLAGVDEITFSIHGHNKKLHEAQTRTPKSFEQTIAGLKNALASKKVIVNIDIVINKINYKYIDEIIKYFIKLGVYEFDLLQVVPAGNAWKNKEKVFYNIKEAKSYLDKAFNLYKVPNLFLWTNRFPPQYLVGFEELIQNPFKLFDEVRGREKEFLKYVKEDIFLPCYPERCPYCFLKNFCQELFNIKKLLKKKKILAIECDLSENNNYNFINNFKFKKIKFIGEQISDNLLNKLAANLELYLQLKKYNNIKNYKNKFKKIVLIISTENDLLKFINTDFIIYINLNKETNNFVIDNLKNIPNNIFLYYENKPTLSLVKEKDINLKEFFKQQKLNNVKTINIPNCIYKNNIKFENFLPLNIFNKEEIDIYKFTSYYILKKYYVKPTQCFNCKYEKNCVGFHINYLRNFGFKNE